MREVISHMKQQQKIIKKKNPLEILGMKNKIVGTFKLRDGINSRMETVGVQIVSWKIKLRKSPRRRKEKISKYVPKESWIAILISWQNAYLMLYRMCNPKPGLKAGLLDHQVYFLNLCLL